MLDTSTIYLDAEVDSETFYEALKDADHWKDRGYEVTNTHTIYEDAEKTTKEVDGVEMEVDEPGPVDHYHAQFAELEEEGLWVHVDVPADTTDEIAYMITMGEQDTIQEDLAAAVNEVLGELDDQG